MKRKKTLKKMLKNFLSGRPKGGAKPAVKEMKALAGKAAPAVAKKTAAKPSKPAAKPVQAEEKKLAKGKGAKGAKTTNSHAAAAVSKAEKAAQIAAGPPVCREVACELIATTGGYCRMHYIKNWKKIKRKEMILRERKLNHYIEELVSKYPDKYIEAIRQDLASEKDFAKVISDLEIEEGLDDFESVDTETGEGIIDNIKRDFEDDGDVF